MAFILKGLNFVINEIASALKTVFGFAAQATAQVLDDIGYRRRLRRPGAQHVFSFAAQAAATVLMAIGYAVNDVATALKRRLQRARRTRRLDPFRHRVQR